MSDSESKSGTDPSVDRIVHTPGPWEHNGNAVHKRISPHYATCVAVCDGESRYGNAKLIAASPEMKSLIEVLYDSLHRGVGPMAGADDGELGELIHDSMCNALGNGWHSGV